MVFNREHFLIIINKFYLFILNNHQNKIINKKLLKFDYIYIYIFRTMN